MLLMTFRDLQFRARRIAVVIGGTTLVFALLLLMSGLSEQFAREPRVTVSAFGASHWLVRAGSPGVFTSATTIDAGVTQGVGGPRRVDPLVTARLTIASEQPKDVVLIGYDGNGALGAPQVVAGRQPQSPDEIAIDESSDLQTGDRAPLGGRTYKVVGLTRDTTLFAGVPLVFIDLREAQAIVYKERPVITAVLTDALPQTMPAGVEARTEAQIIADSGRPLEEPSKSIDLVKSLLWAVSAMIIGGVVYLSALERRRDFAVLKASGATSRWLLGGLAMQSASMALVSAGLAVAVSKVLVPAFPMKVAVTGATMVRLPLVAVAVALLAGIGGLRQVARTDPAAAFSGPGA